MTLSNDDAAIIMQAARMAARHRTRTIDQTAYLVIEANHRANRAADEATAIERANRERWPILSYGVAVLAARRVLADGDHFAGMPAIPSEADR